jgi:hypothetical protein
MKLLGVCINTVLKNFLLNLFPICLNNLKQHFLLKHYSLMIAKRFSVDRASTVGVLVQQRDNHGITASQRVHCSG